MRQGFLRVLHASGGSIAAIVVIAALQVNAVASAGLMPPSTTALVVALVGLLFPVAIAVAVVVAIGSLLVDPGEPTSVLAIVATLRRGTTSERERRAAVAPVVVLGAFAWCVLLAHSARAKLFAADAAQTGPTMGTIAAVSFLACTAVALAAVPIVRRGVALASGAVRAFGDPVVTTAGALLLAALLAIAGAAADDASGTTGVLGIFGVLKRSELDLRPAVSVLFIAISAHLAVLAATAANRRVAAGVASLVLLAASASSCLYAASSLGRRPGVLRAIEHEAPLTKVMLHTLRGALDRDHDGFSPLFGGGDCNDHDPAINVGALDAPGNGVDEDCSGADTPVVLDDTTSPDPKPTGRPATRAFNVVLITVDALRGDALGFAGYPKPVSPNLDALAARGTVFENAYAQASTTGKSLGPLLIGKYPSETLRDSSNNETYDPGNVFVAERLRDAGMRTFAAHCLFYLREDWGLNQGFSVWDTSAMPAQIGDTDVITDDRESDAALALLADPANTGGTKPFFAWFHYLDPHALYVAHAGAPNFARDGEPAKRAAYDGEVWFTDRQIGRVLAFIEAQRWADRTAIIVTADHGEAFGEHGMSWHGLEVWNELVHVPLVIVVPGAEPRRVVEKRSHIDVAPTILELTGLALPPRAEVHGTSLLDDVFAPRGVPLVERDVLIDMPKGELNGLRRAFVTGKSPGLKVIYFGDERRELFDLARDPSEKNDLSEDTPMLRGVNDAFSRALARMKSVAPAPRRAN